MLAVFPTCSSGVFPPVSPHLLSLLPIFLPPAPCPLHESPSEPGSLTEPAARGRDEAALGPCGTRVLDCA